MKLVFVFFSLVLSGQAHAVTSAAGLGQGLRQCHREFKARGFMLSQFHVIRTQFVSPNIRCHCNNAHSPNAWLSCETRNGDLIPAIKGWQ